jgi:dihydrofolate reductase
MMVRLRFGISMSVDGFIAGPNPSEEQPLGEGGEQLHEWVVKLAAWRKPHGLEGGEVNASTDVLEESLDNIGATVMGRNMFGGGPGPWREDPWEGWWGDDPPFHTPVFVLTHHEREPLRKQGGTTFTFVTDGIESALEQAKEAAGGKDVCSAAARPSSSSTWRAAWSTSSSSVSFRSCSARAPGSSTTSPAPMSSWSPSGSWTPPASPTSRTGSSDDAHDEAVQPDKPRPLEPTT